MRSFKRLERKEGLVAQPGQDPPLRDLHSDLDLRFVARLSRSDRYDRRAVVPANLDVPAVDRRFVATRYGYRTPKLIGHGDRRHAAEIHIRLHMRADEICYVLRQRR